ncbi:hypothetical protein LRP88_14670 [Fusarium phalaenopsidis]
MQICVLQATCPDGHILHEHDEYADPGRYVKQHNFHHRFIDKANYRQQIDAAVAEKLDSYINFMWGQPEDEVAGVETTEYFESLNVPFIGLRGPFQANDMAGGSWGNVDIRIKPDGKPVVIEVNPMPAVFLPLDFGYEETVIWNSSPGEYRALLNIMMASYMMRSETYDNVRQDLIGKVYNRVALQYDAQYNPQSSAEEVFGRLLSKFNFDGSLLDIACGTGLFGRLIRAEQHIMCYQAIRFVSAFEVSLVLSRCFQLANKSVTIGVDEIPEAYNEAIKKLPPPNNVMTSINHVQEVRDFGVPRGWKLALEEQVFGWKSPNTNVDVNTTLFHFEQI